jgi:hypothetical protein
MYKAGTQSDYAVIGIQSLGTGMSKNSKKKVVYDTRNPMDYGVK